MPQITPAQARQYAAAAGFTGAGLDTIVQIAGAESGWNTDGPPATSAPNTGPGLGACYGSIDRGIVQINDCAHPQVSSSDPGSCAYNPACAFGFAYQLSHQGTYFGDWSTFTNGSYRTFSTGADAGAQASGSGGAAASGTPLFFGIPGTPSLPNPLDLPGKIASGVGNTITNWIQRLLPSPKKIAGSVAGALAQQLAGVFHDIGAAIIEGLKRAGIFLAGLVAIGIGGMILASAEVKQVTQVAAAPRGGAGGAGEEAAPTTEAAV